MSVFWSGRRGLKSGRSRSANVNHVAATHASGLPEALNRLVLLISVFIAYDR